MQFNAYKRNGKKDRNQNKRTLKGIFYSDFWKYFFSNGRQDKILYKRNKRLKLKLQESYKVKKKNNNIICLKKKADINFIPIHRSLSPDLKTTKSYIKLVDLKKVFKIRQYK